MRLRALAGTSNIDRGSRPYITTLIALLISIVVRPAAADDRVPLPPIPPEARRFDVSAESFKINGLPSHLAGFLSSRSPAEVAKWYRQQLGEPLADNRLGKRQVLGREHDGHYITVQLEPMEGGTRGLVSVSSLQDMQRNHDAELHARERWQNRLPANSQLLSLISSKDVGQAATFVAFANGHDETLNQESLKRLMREEGLELERSSGAGVQIAATDPRVKAGTTLFFKGSGKEAMATIFRTSGELTAVVLNITASAGSDQ